MVVSDPTKALMLLGETGTLALENEVLMIDAANEPGVLAKMAERLAEAKINIEYCYSATPPEAKKELETALRNKPSDRDQGKIKELLAKVG